MLRGTGFVFNGKIRIFEIDKREIPENLKEITLGSPKNEE